MTRPYPHGLAIDLHLLRRHQPGMIVLVSGKRQPEALDRVANEAGRLLRIRIVECVKHRWQVVSAEIVHESSELGITAPFDQPADVALIADFIIETFSPCGS